MRRVFLFLFHRRSRTFFGVFLGGTCSYQPANLTFGSMTGGSVVNSKADRFQEFKDICETKEFYEPRDDDLPRASRVTSVTTPQNPAFTEVSRRQMMNRRAYHFAPNLTLNAISNR